MMTQTAMQEQILLVLQDRGVPLSPSELSLALHCRGKERKQVQKAVHDLARRGEIEPRGDGAYGISSTGGLISGVLDIFSSGRGVVRDTSKSIEVFIEEGLTGVALPGDRVMVRCFSDKMTSNRGNARFPVRPNRPDSARKSGEVIRLLERARHEVVGTIRTMGRAVLVTPLSTSYKRPFRVANRNGVPDGYRVLVRFIDWESPQRDPDAEILEVIGPADRPSTDTISIIRQYQLPREFSSLAVREAENVSCNADNPGPRMDLRDRYILTIDPVAARDFDDALSLEPSSDGTAILGIHIADVAHFVPQGGSIDREAAERGNSVYLVDRVIPMLPEQLSNGICSLIPDKDRLAFSVFLEIDAAGHVVSSSFSKSIIRSRKRLTYEEVLPILKTCTKIDSSVAQPSQPPEGCAKEPPDETADLLCRLHALAQRLRRRRFARYALDLDVPECEVLLDPNGETLDVQMVSNDVSHQLVEECMVAANEAVATELARRGIPSIARIHKKPFASKIEELQLGLSALGFHPGDLCERRNLAALLREVADHPLGYHVRLAVLRSMTRACYSTETVGHFGLAKRFYSHFTSPIRRYPDLIVHRQLQAALTGTKPYSLDQLKRIAETCSLTERRADDAERSLTEIKKFRLLSHKIEVHSLDQYEAVVLQVRHFGLVVDVPKFQVQGLVHVSAMNSLQAQYRKRDSSFRLARRLIRVGDTVPVILANVDVERRRVDFALRPS